MDYKELAGNLRLSSFGKNYNLVDLERKEAADAITELIERAETAEKRASNAEYWYGEEIGRRKAAEIKAEKAEAERDEISDLCGKLAVLCEQPKEWRSKMFRKYQVSMIGDYMGSGYPFVDAFNRIYIEFEETASDGAYEALRKSTDSAALQNMKEE